MSDPNRHEPIVSDTLEQNASRQNREAEQTEDATEEIAATRERLRDGDGPRKRHGDALEDGSGNRHGVNQTDPRREQG